MARWPENKNRNSEYESGLIEISVVPNCEAFGIDRSKT